MYLELKKIRNIGFVAHIDAGKTTTTERVLYYTGRIHRLGEVDEGTATTDWMQQEKERGITITSAATFCRWRDSFINIIDTPGHVDFTAEVERALRILDGLIIIFCGVGGVEPQSETVWHQADRYKIPRIAFINKLDRLGASPESVIKQMSEKFSITPLRLQFPIGIESNFVGVVDLVKRSKYIWDVDPTGENYRKEPIEDHDFQMAYEELIFTLSDLDERVLDEYEERGVVAPELLKEVIREGTIKGLWVPVLMGSALRNKGIQPLLDAIIDYLPSPVDVPVPVGKDPQSGLEIKRKPDKEEPFSGVIFKVQWDKHIGRLLYTRIYSGSLRVGEKVLNTVTGKSSKVLRIYRMHANKKETLRDAYAGEIVALIGIKDGKTGDTLSDPKDPILYEGMQFPEPVVNLSIEPKTLKDLEKLESILQDMHYEDPTFKFREDPDTGQIIISGMGELHLEIIVDRIKREYGLPVRVGRPQVNYRETITKCEEESYIFQKEISGVLHYGRIKVRVCPNRKTNFTMNLPEGLTEVLESVIRDTSLEVLNFGPIFGYPLINISIEVLEVETDRSTDFGIRVAFMNAVKNALRKANPILMEPVMSLEVLVPTEAVGNVVSDIGHRGGELQGIEALENGYQRVKALVPLKSLFGYVTDLRSLTQGRGTFWMKLEKFAPVPEKELKEMIPL